MGGHMHKKDRAFAMRRAKEVEEREEEKCPGAVWKTDACMRTSN